MPENKSDVLFDEANKEWEAGNTKRAFELFSRAVEQGDLSALINLGYFYDLGISVSKNEERALQLYKKAFRKGLRFAANNIGTIYRDKGNFARAKFWFMRSVEDGDGDAALELAKMYLSRKAAGDTKQASRYLKRVINGKSVTQASVEEAIILLKKLQSQKGTR
ncbi:MAG TPA: tetratricopeptide repeat protein [Alphaproteobacteria bacterium]|nr:tetratricopeptide repeat protein [Alphaproteobacteria bacterium]